VTELDQALDTLADQRYVKGSLTAEEHERPFAWARAERSDRFIRRRESLGSFLLPVPGEVLVILERVLRRAPPGVRPVSQQEAIEVTGGETAVRAAWVSGNGKRFPVAGRCACANPDCRKFAYCYGANSERRICLECFEFVYHCKHPKLRRRRAT